MKRVLFFLVAVLPMLLLSGEVSSKSEQTEVVQPCKEGEQVKKAPGDFMSSDKSAGMHGAARWEAGYDIFVIMSKIKKEQPEEFARLDALRKSDMRSFMRELSKYMPKRPGLKRFGELRSEERVLARKILETKDPVEKSKLEELLKAKLKEDFNLMMKDAEERIIQMQQRMAVIKENEEQFLKGRYEIMLKRQQKLMENGLPENAPFPFSKDKEGEVGKMN